MFMVVFFSISLAVLNLLPIPVLDGGHADVPDRGGHPSEAAVAAAAACGSRRSAMLIVLADHASSHCRTMSSASSRFNDALTGYAAGRVTAAQLVAAG